MEQWRAATPPRTWVWFALELTIAIFKLRRFSLGSPAHGGASPYTKTMAKAQKIGRCVHCLGLVPNTQMTTDGVPARSWYSKQAISAAQRWKVPCCRRCKDALRPVESGLLIWLRPGNAYRDESAGVASMAQPSLRLDEGDHVPIPYSDLSKIAEKFARGCEYKLANRYVEPPYGLRAFIAHPDEMTAVLDREQIFDLAPGFKVKCVRNDENRGDVAFWFLLRDTVCLKVFITFESVLAELEPKFSRLKKLTRDVSSQACSFPA